MVAALLEYAFSNLTLNPAGFLLTGSYLVFVDLLGFFAVEFALQYEGTAECG